MLQVRNLCAVLLLAWAAVNGACADPWPDYSAHTSPVTYVDVSPVNTSGTIWEYLVTVDPRTNESGHGGLAGVKALAVYPNGGGPEQQLDGWTGDAAYVEANWDSNGGWHTQQGAFGYRTTNPSYYIIPGQSGQMIGKAQFPTGYVPPSQVFLVHVACNDGYTYWARPTAVPEPGLAATCLAGAISFIGLVRRKKR